VFEPLQPSAQAVRFHHVPWDAGRGTDFDGQAVHPNSHLLHLADRIVVLIDPGLTPLRQVKTITETIRAHCGAVFVPQHVDAFMRIACRESVWLDLAHQLDVPHDFPQMVQLDLAALLDLAKVFSHVIDFRSRFTATHSAGIACVAETLGRLSGFSPREIVLLKIAGYLHDLGKLAVPTSILEAPRGLTADEFAVMRTHTYHTYEILSAIPHLEAVAGWAAYHHERLDGNGYPFHLSGHDLCLCARIMAISDVFTALSEERPYRAGMDSQNALEIVSDMVANGSLDERLVELLRANLDEIDTIRSAGQAEARSQYAALFPTLVGEPPQ
jgi:response regulator RpfG family c-di-GMP phosphodiesterase